MRFLPFLFFLSFAAHADYQCRIEDIVQPGADGGSIVRPALALEKIERNFTVKQDGEVVGAYPTSGYRHEVFPGEQGLKVISVGAEDDQKMIQVLELYLDPDGVSFNRYIGNVGTLLVGRCVDSQ